MTNDTIKEGLDSISEQLDRIIALIEEINEDLR